jgi:AcrR family transcriptional regulator
MKTGRGRPAKARTALVEATKRLLVLDEFDAFTIDRLVAEAGVSRASFYNHFDSVEELVLQTQRAVQAELDESLGAALADKPDPATAIARGVVTLVWFGYTNRANASVLMVNGPAAADPSDTGNRVLTDILTEGIEAGAFDLLNVEMGVVAIRGICELGLTRMLTIHREYSAVEKLAFGMAIASLRALGVTRRIEPTARDAVAEWFGPDGNHQSLARPTTRPQYRSGVGTATRRPTTTTPSPIAPRRGPSR